MSLSSLLSSGSTNPQNGTRENDLTSSGLRLESIRYSRKKGGNFPSYSCFNLIKMYSLMLQSRPAQERSHSHLPSSWWKVPWPEQSGRQVKRASFRFSQLRPIQPKSQWQRASWQTPWSEQVGSGQCPEKEFSNYSRLLRSCSKAALHKNSPDK